MKIYADNRENLERLRGKFPGNPRNFAGNPRNFAAYPRNFAAYPRNFAANPWNFPGTPAGLSGGSAEISGPLADLSGAPTWAELYLRTLINAISAQGAQAGRPSKGVRCLPARVRPGRAAAEPGGAAPHIRGTAGP